MKASRRKLMAFMCGPFVLAGKFGGEGLTKENTHTAANWCRFRNVPLVPYHRLFGERYVVYWRVYIKG